MQIGQALKELRKKKSLQQQDAAKLIGITQSYLSQIECDNKAPSKDVLTKISLAYGMPVGIIYFMAIEPNIDIPKGKRKLFAQVKPLMDDLLSNVF